MTRLSIARRALLQALPPLLAATAPARAQPAAAAWPRQMTDLVGRRVTLQAPPRAILLPDSQTLMTLALLHPDPVSLLVGTGGDLAAADPAMEAAFQRRFPRLASLPRVTGGLGQPFSIEAALTLQPDLVILSAWRAGLIETERQIEQFAAAGIPVVFIDLFQKPLSGTPPSVRLLGEVLDRREQAEAFIAFHESRLAVIRQRIAQAGPGPRLLLTAFPGRWPCCWVPGEAGIGELLALLNLRNATSGVVGPRGGSIGVEQVLSLQPDVVIGTGDSQPGDGLRLGSDVPEAEARRSLERLAQDRAFGSLSAVRAGRIHGLWNFFPGTALNILAAEAMARWLRPDLFADLDPAATLAEINRRFSALPFEGSFWISLRQEQ